MYVLLRSISAPRKLKELSFTEIVEIPAKHLDPKPIVIAERYKFHKAEQEESESIRQYLAKLQKLAAETSLSLQTAVEKACAAELTEQESAVVHGDAVVKMLDGIFPECGKTNVIMGA